MIANIAVTDNSAYSMPTWAITIAAIWFAIVVVLHVYAFLKAKHTQPRSGSTHPSNRPLG